MSEYAVPLNPGDGEGPHFIDKDVVSPKHLTLGDLNPQQWNDFLYLKSKCHSSTSEQGRGAPKPGNMPPPPGLVQAP